MVRVAGSGRPVPGHESVSEGSIVIQGDRCYVQRVEAKARLCPVSSVLCPGRKTRLSTSAVPAEDCWYTGATTGSSFGLTGTLPLRLETPEAGALAIAAEEPTEAGRPGRRSAV